MKKILLLTLMVATVFACRTTKIERQAEKTFKGQWMLNDVTYPNNSGFVDVTLFQDASAKCFKGSMWNFISNNNEGSYTLGAAASCDSGLRNFVWAVQEVDTKTGLYYFTLKVVPEGQNPRKIGSGFRLKLVALSETDMTWEQTVSFEGKPFLIRMTFTKL